MIKAYLAGPDVFYPNALAHADLKKEICARHGIEGRPPLNEDIQDLLKLPADKAWRAIYCKDVEMMDECEIAIANLTPFGGVSADSGTLIEVGYFLGQGKPVFGYSNSSQLFDVRMARFKQLAPSLHLAGASVEAFDLPDNLMIPGAVLQAGGHPMVLPDDGMDRPFDALDIFEKCVLVANRSDAVSKLKNSHSSLKIA